MIRLFIILFVSLPNQFRLGNFISYEEHCKVVSEFRYPSEHRSIDVSKSIVRWKGTKLMGAGSHEGTVKFNRGFLQFDQEKIVGGEFVVDMTSLENTDIPLRDPVPRKNLMAHLSLDFDIRKFQTASFRITNVHGQGEEDSQITGVMVIKGIARTIQLKTRKLADCKYQALFSINRHHWKIGEQGSWLEKKLVDPKIFLEVEIVCQQ